MKWLICAILIVVFAACKKDNDGPPAGDNMLSTDSLVALAADIPDHQYLGLTFTSAVTGYALGSKFIARMSANKAMILGYGFEGTRVLVLEW